MNSQTTPPECGPLETLLLAIALAERTIEPVTSNDEDGPEVYVMHARDWQGILECAADIETPLVIAQGENPTSYIVNPEGPR